MKTLLHSILNRISFEAKTTILVWIIVVGFGLIVSVGVLALIGLKSEFDINSSQNHNIHTLMLLIQSDTQDKQHLPHLLHVWEQYKLQNTNTRLDSASIHLRKWYAQTFMPDEYQQIQDIVSQKYMLIESIDKAFIQQNIAALPALLKEQILLSFDMAFYGKQITDSLYHNTFIVLAIFMCIVFATIIILSLSIRRSINTNHLLLEQLVHSKTKELQILNANLQKSIDHEVEQSRKKDLIMYQQARLASMGEMIQNIAHQWRQPLNSLMVLIQSFKSKAMQNKLEVDFVLQQTQYGMKIATEMSNTIENFRNFFRPETNTELFEPYASIHDAIELLKEQLRENLISIHVSEPEKHISIKGYQNSFMQVVLILINNAIDALKLKFQNDSALDKSDMSKSGMGKSDIQPNVQPCIEILLYKVGYNITLCVKDNAGGIHLEDNSKVFEPYFTTKHKSAGTGVGLYMAKQIIERQFNGSINVSNTQWNTNYFGAEFTINIPAQKDINET